MSHKGVLGVWQFIPRRAALRKERYGGEREKLLEGKSTRVHTHTCIRRTNSSLAFNVLYLKTKHIQHSFLVQDLNIMLLKDHSSSV